jgi:hypothetical protein
MIKASARKHKTVEELIVGQFEKKRRQFTQRREGAKETQRGWVAAWFVCFLCGFAPLREIPSC